MPMNTKKIDNYSLMNVGHTLCLAVLLVLSAVACSLITPAGITNNPPFEPSNPNPENGSTDIPISADLSWTGGAPGSGILVTYDVFFGTTSPPPKQANNLSATTYDPGTLTYITHYYWRITAWNNLSESTAGPLWSFTTEEKPNSPPNIPSAPHPANQSTGVSLDTLLSWTGGDPDNDTVTYDIYFGATTQPPKVVANHPTPTYDPDGLLSYDTTYYWKIIAWDNHSTNATGPLWHFTTKAATITVTISKPLENKMYFRDEPLFNLTNRTIVYGSLTITANVTADAGVAKVEFYINGKLKGNDTTAPYTYTWAPKLSLNGLSLKHTISVIATDTLGNNASAEVNVSKWRFHPLPFIVAAATVASTFIPHTTIRGFVFNMRETTGRLSFFALRIHYKTVSLLKSASGVMQLKSITLGPVIGPVTTIRFGPFHSFAWISCTCLGTIHYVSDDSLQGLLQQLLKNTQDTSRQNMPCS